MNDDKIRDVLEKIRVPEPREEARKLALDNALQEFNKKHQKTTQGYSITYRLKDIINQLDKVITMKKLYYYGPSLTAIALVIGVMSSNQFSTSYKEFIPVSAPALKAQKLPPVSLPPASSTTAESPASPPPLPSIPSPPTEAFSPLPPERTVNISEDAEHNSPPPSLLAPAPVTVSKKTEQYKAMPPQISGAESSGSISNASAISSAKVGGLLSKQSYAPDYLPQPQYEGNDKFEKTKSNPVKLVTEEPVSTFSIDVDTASYSFVRRQLNYGQLPQKDAVRVEEMINYFDYNYALPENKAEPFKPSISVYPSPWHKGNKLVHIGIKGYDIAKTTKPRSNLVFLIDTSGSMQEKDKLPLLISSFSMLVESLGANDTVSIVTYAGSAGTVLEPTKVKNKAKILAALNNLQAGGSTAGAEGIKQAYALAADNFDKGGVNRVILATDGDFNVGISDPEELKTYIEKKRESGVFLSVLGFGQGNYNDALMQKLAQNGNGNAAYIDNINEARKVLVEEASSTLFPIAKDVKIQVEFNKAKVSEYRLIGYETRLLNREDFNNDKVDAGEIGSGHAVTAIYEITPKGEKGLVDEPRYAETENKKEASNKDEYGFLKIRYKLPAESASKLLTTPITSQGEFGDVEKAPQDVKFATAVAAFGQLLHGDNHIGNFSFDEIIKLAEGSKGQDKFGYRAEFLNLVRTAKVARSSEVPPVPAGAE